eukprot:TRINITY_DN10555_c0_g3_i2.p1 TRINITY_DN10555_c0_g3~~TRINITY_DN10555_c0_g3_i2.p1  ORF type:complete len:414 (+),score=112.91 TRINITY_DN10555_c0_g3_i2:73-1314(+)
MCIRDRVVKCEAKNRIIEILLSQEVPKQSLQRTAQFLKILNKTKINLVLLKSLSFGGIPAECEGLRGVVWRLLFGQLPPETAKWEEFLRMRQSQYDDFKNGLVIIPTLPKLQPGQSIEVEDHPLSLSKTSRWFMFYKDDDTRKQINKDIRRTKADIPFFKELAHPSEESKNSSLFIPSNAEITGLDNNDEGLFGSEGETHRHVLARILLIYSKLNLGVNYVQGMNELLATIYYCFHKYSPKMMMPHLESDSFFCFGALMGEVRDEYMREMDSEDSGINGKMQFISDLIRKVDPEFHEFFKTNNIAVNTFALRWVMLLFAQDLQLEEVIRLWDTLLSDNERFLFFDYVLLQVILDSKEKAMEAAPHTINRVMGSLTEEIDLIRLLERAGALLAKDQDKEEYNVKQYPCFCHTYM